MFMRADAHSMLVVSVKLSFHFQSLILHDTCKMFRFGNTPRHNTALNGNHLVTLKSQNLVYGCHHACRSLDVPTQIVCWMRSLKMWLKSVHFQLFPFLRGIPNIYSDPHPSYSLYICVYAKMNIWRWRVVNGEWWRLTDTSEVDTRSRYQHHHFVPCVAMCGYLCLSN